MELAEYDRLVAALQSPADVVRLSKSTPHPHAYQTLWSIYTQRQSLDMSRRTSLVRHKWLNHFMDRYRRDGVSMSALAALGPYAPAPNAKAAPKKKAKPAGGSSTAGSTAAGSTQLNAAAARTHGGGGHHHHFEWEPFSPVLFARSILEFGFHIPHKRITPILYDPHTELSKLATAATAHASAAAAAAAAATPATSSATAAPAPIPFPPPLAGMSDPELQRLIADVQTCVDSDQLYAPIYDKMRELLGWEYERRLESYLDALRVPFVTEQTLRVEGWAKTPDVRLSVPFATNSGHVVNWIDSKAMFGDPNAREKNRPQLSGYVNRFGTGAVIYWFGYVRLPEDEEWEWIDDPATPAPANTTLPRDEKTYDPPPHPPPSPQQPQPATSDGGTASPVSRRRRRRRREVLVLDRFPRADEIQTIESTLEPLVPLTVVTPSTFAPPIASGDPVVLPAAVSNLPPASTAAAPPAPASQLPTISEWHYDSSTATATDEKSSPPLDAAATTLARGVSDGRLQPPTLDDADDVDADADADDFVISTVPLSAPT